MSQQRRNLLFSVETIIVLVIAGCMIFLNFFMRSKIEELQRVPQDVIFVMEDLDYPDADVLMEHIKEYLPSTYKMIEIYNEDFEIVMQVQFSDEVYPLGDIRDYPELMETLERSNEGQTSYKVGKTEQNVYFRWMNTSENQNRLLMVYTSVPEVNNIWVFSLVSYLVLVLVFVLLILQRTRHHYANISTYDFLSNMAKKEGE